MAIHRFSRRLKATACRCPMAADMGDASPARQSCWKARSIKARASPSAKLLEGEVDQSEGVALNGRQLHHGYVLLCVARPQSDCRLDVGVESHDKLYRNPFKTPLRPDELKAGIRAEPGPLEDTP